MRVGGKELSPYRRKVDLSGLPVSSYGKGYGWVTCGRARIGERVIGSCCESTARLCVAERMWGERVFDASRRGITGGLRGAESELDKRS